jgi:PIN domain nuclease of toxin-antitoxin system
MRYLLDTQVIVWFVENNKRLSPLAKSLIEDSDNDIFVCQFSYVEIAIKEALNKVVVQNGLKSLIEEVEEQSIEVLTLSQNHILAYSQIPLNDNHKDRVSPTHSTE